MKREDYADEKNGDNRLETEVKRKDPLEPKKEKYISSKILISAGLIIIVIIIIHITSYF